MLAMCLMSAPAAKKPLTREATTTTLASAISSSEASSPSMMGSPSALAGGRRSASVTMSSPWRSISTSDSRSSIGPDHRTGRQYVAAERAAEGALHGPARVEQRFEVDARRDAHLVQHRDEVLGRDVAGRTGRDRTAA